MIEVVSPKHYVIEFINGVKIESINVIQANLTSDEFVGYCKGNALKYILRANKKHDTPTIDYLKAMKNLEFLTRHLDGKLAVEEDLCGSELKNIKGKETF